MIPRLTWRQDTVNCYTGVLMDWISVTVRRKRQGLPWRLEMAGQVFFEDWRQVYESLPQAQRAAEKRLALDLAEAYRIISTARALEKA